MRRRRGPTVSTLSGPGRAGSRPRAGGGRGGDSGLLRGSEGLLENGFGACATAAVKETQNRRLAARSPVAQDWASARERRLGPQAKTAAGKAAAQGWALQVRLRAGSVALRGGAGGAQGRGLKLNTAAAAGRQGEFAGLCFPAGASLGR